MLSPPRRLALPPSTPGFLLLLKFICVSSSFDIDLGIGGTGDGFTVDTGFGVGLWSIKNLLASDEEDDSCVKYRRSFYYRRDNCFRLRSYSNSFARKLWREPLYESDGWVFLYLIHGHDSQYGTFRKPGGIPIIYSRAPSPV
jgi:hypothetical protein